MANNLLDDAVIAALRCEYYRQKGKKPVREYLFWQFVAEHFAKVLKFEAEDCYYDCLHSVFDKNVNLMANIYPTEYEAIKANKKLAAIYFNKDK